MPAPGGAATRKQDAANRDSFNPSSTQQTVSVKQRSMKPLLPALRFLGALLLAGGLTAPLLRAQTPEQQAVSPAGEWLCVWNTPRGDYFSGVVKLAAREDGTLAGQIVWTLKKSPQPEEQTKLGLSGTEFIRGTYDFKTRLVLLEGYRKEDPAEVIGLDRYKLVFADNGAALGGLTENHGTWSAFFSALRK